MERCVLYHLTNPFILCLPIGLIHPLSLRYNKAVPPVQYPERKEGGIPAVTHLGITAHVPKNTTPAFHKVQKLGAYGVVYGIRYATDNRYVVYPNDDIGCISNGTDKLLQTTAACRRRTRRVFFPRFPYRSPLSGHNNHKQGGGERKMREKHNRIVRAVVTATAFLLSAALLALAGLMLYSMWVWKNGQGLFETVPFLAYGGLWITVTAAAVSMAGSVAAFARTWQAQTVRFPWWTLIGLLAALCMGAASLTDAARVLHTQRRQTTPAVVVFLPADSRKCLDSDRQIEYDWIQ